MPVVLTFDLSDVEPQLRNRIQSFFERFGWQQLGGSAWRYPRLGAELEHPMEDWFNHVIPALMLFRTHVLNNAITVEKFTLDVQSSTGYTSEGLNGEPYGAPIAAAGDITLYPPTQAGFGEANLRQWLGQTNYPYQPAP